MTRAKYIIAFFLFLAAFLFIGESYTFFLENFQESYVQVGYYLETGDSEEQMNADILESSAEYNALVFALHKEDGGAFSRTITIYGDENVKNILKEDWGIESGSVNSFFSGKTTFIFEPFQSANEKAMRNCWYIGKTQDELYTMLFPGMVKYSGNFRNSPIQSTSEIVVSGVWLLILLAILMLTAYDTAYGKKEQLVRMILGANIQRLKFRKISADLLGLTISALAAFLLLLPFTATEFRIEVSIVCFIVLLIINSFAILLGMRLKKGIPLRSVLTNKVLGASMAIKGMAAVLSIVVLSTTLALSVEGVKLYSQKEHYISQQNRVHVEINYPYSYEKMEKFAGYSEGIPPLNMPEQLQDNFLRYSYKELSNSLLYAHSYEDVAPLYGKQYVFANLKGLEQYKESIPDWDMLCANEGNYILVSDTENTNEIMNELRQISNIIGISESNLDGVFTYSDEISVIAEGRRDAEYDYTYHVKNPVIILDTYDYGKLPTYPVSYSLRKPDNLDGVIFNQSYYLLQFVSIENDASKIYAFADVCGGDAINPKLMEFSTVNISNWFNGLWALQNRSLLIAVILTLLLVILGVQITMLTLRIFYETKAKELTIKKVMGFSIYERYGSFFILSGCICILSLIAALILSTIFHIGVASYLIYGSIIVWFMDWLILLFLTKKNDGLQIQKVLKGGI